MSNNKDLATTYTDGKQTVVVFIKNQIFDLIGLAIVIAMMALMLNIVEGRPFTWETLKQVAVMVIPFYICAMMLSLNYYKKGSYAGKRTTQFESAVKTYSNIVGNLTGNQIRHFREFCKEYNDTELADMRTDILKEEGLTYKEFVENYIHKSFFTIWHQKSFKIAWVIRKAKKAKVKGISANSVLGNRKCNDNTDLGPTETQLAAGRGVGYAAGYVISIGFLTFLVVRNFGDWNWARLLYEFAKVVYIFMRSYMRYFEGYEDITIRLSDSINRKTDTLKAYKAWYEEKNYSDERDEEETAQTENNDD